MSRARELFIKQNNWKYRNPNTKSNMVTAKKTPYRNCKMYSVHIIRSYSVRRRPTLLERNCMTDGLPANEDTISTTEALGQIK